MGKTKSGKIYKVLIECRDDGTGKHFYPGDTCTLGDFPEEIIQDWLSISPPVLEELDKQLEAEETEVNKNGKSREEQIT